MKAWGKAFKQRKDGIFSSHWAILGLIIIVLLCINGCQTISGYSSYNANAQKAPAPNEPPTSSDVVLFSERSNKLQFFLPQTGGDISGKPQEERSIGKQQQNGFCSPAEQQQNSCGKEEQNPSPAPTIGVIAPPEKNLYYEKAIHLLPCADFLCPLTTLRATRLMQRSIDKNVIALTSAAVDSLRNRIYTIGRYTPTIAVLDGVSEEWQNTLESTFPIEDIPKKIYLDPTANYLYLLDLKNQQLKRLDLSSGEMIGPILMPEGNGIAAVDTLRSRFYLFSRKTPTFTILDGKNLNRLATNNDLPATIQDAVFHPSSDSLIVLASLNDTEDEIIVWDAKTSRISSQVRFPKAAETKSQALAVDQNGTRYFIACGNWIYVIQRDGKILKQIPLPQDVSFKGMAYDPTHDILAVAAVKCASTTSTCRGGEVLFYNPTAGNLLSTLKAGDVLDGIIFNPANYHFYAFGENEPGIWSLSADIPIEEAYLISLGDSIEHVVLAQQGKKFYWNSRFGDNYLIGYTVDEGVYEVVSNVRMPMLMQTVNDKQDGEHLFVLNVWDSRLNDFTTQPHTILKHAIDLGIPSNTSTCLPDFTVDSDSGLAFVALPQFGKITVADWRKGTLHKYIALNEFTLTRRCDVQPQIQVLTNAEEQQLYVLLNQPQNHRLLIFESKPPFSLLQEVNLEQLGWKQIDRSALTKLLFLDAENNRLFIGPYTINPKTLSLTKEKLARGQAVFAIDPLTDSYLAIGIEESNERLSYIIMALFRKSLSMRQSYTLSSPRVIRPGIAFDPQRRLLYVSDVVRAEVQLYSVGNYR